MKGANLISSATVGGLGAGWKVFSAGDVNGDGNTDLLFVNSTINQDQVWLMNGTQVTSMQAPTGGVLPATLGTSAGSNPVLGEAEAYYGAGVEPTGSSIRGDVFSGDTGRVASLTTTIGGVIGLSLGQT